MCGAGVKNDDDESYAPLIVSAALLDTEETRAAADYCAAVVTPPHPETFFGSKYRRCWEYQNICSLYQRDMSWFLSCSLLIVNSYSNTYRYCYYYYYYYYQTARLPAICVTCYCVTVLRVT